MKQNDEIPNKIPPANENQAAIFNGSIFGINEVSPPQIRPTVFPSDINEISQIVISGDIPALTARPIKLLDNFY